MKKKSINAIVLVLVCLLAAASLSGCGISDRKLSGKWKCISSEKVENAGSGLTGDIAMLSYAMVFPEGSTLEFFSNNTVTLGSVGINVKYKWSDGSHISISTDGQGSMSFKVETEMNSMVLSNDIVKLTYTKL